MKFKNFAYFLENNYMIGFNPLICIKHLPSQFPKMIEIMERSKVFLSFMILTYNLEIL